MQRKEPRRTAFLPRRQQYAAGSMTTSDSAKPRCILWRWFGSIAAFDLNQDELQSISALHARARFAVILANCYQIDYAARFASALACEGEQMPVRPRILGDGMADANLRHSHSPFCGMGRNLEASHRFWVSLFALHSFGRGPRFRR